MKKLGIKIKNTSKAGQKVFSEKKYILLSFIVFAIFIFLIGILANYKFIVSIFNSGGIDFATKFKVLINSVSALWLQNDVLNVILILFIGILASINASMLLYQIRQRVKNNKATTSGFLGLIASIFGIGCSACGSVILTSVVGLGGSLAITSTLPLHGREFLLISMVLLGYAILSVGDKIIQPAICSITK